MNLNISETSKIKDNTVSISYNSVNYTRNFEREKNRLDTEFTGTYEPKKIKKVLYFKLKVKLK